MNKFEDKENFEPPCPCGVQMSGCLFGFLLGLIGFLLTKSHLLISSCIAFGATFGTLGSSVQNPFLVNKRELSIEFAAAFVITFLLYSFFNANSMLFISIVSFIASTFVTSLKQLSSILGLMQVDFNKLGEGCHAV